jgi:hypothetical protein
VEEAVGSCTLYRFTDGPRVWCRDGQEISVFFDESPVSRRACRRVIRLIHPVTITPGRADYDVPGPAFSSRGRAYTETGTAPYESVCFPAQNSLALVAGIAPDSVDILFFSQVAEALAYHGVPEDAHLVQEISEITVAGRRILFPPGCGSRGRQNVTCYPQGQFSWTTHETMAKARERADAQIAGTKNAGLPVEDVLAEDTVSCTFLGEDATCRRLAYQMQVEPDLRRILISYYTTAEMDGHPIMSICSFYDHQTADGGLSRLCSSLFSVEDASADAPSTFRRSAREAFESRP